MDLYKRRFAQLEQIAQDRRHGRTNMTGFPTGVAQLDEKLGGWQPGIVSLIAARPGAGKSSLGLATADACSAAGHGAHLFSLEDTEDAYADRSIARASSVAAEKLRNADLERDDLRAITHAHASIKGRHWIIDGRSGITADEIVRSVRRHRKANNTRVALVDYVQLVKHPLRKPRLSTHEALGEIITTLADAAKHDGIAYVVMSQLNRDIERRQDKRPQLADLRESGSLEERAKCVVGLYRGSMYGDPIKGIDWDPDWDGHRYKPSADEHAAQVQLCVLKNSNGRTGTVFAHWNGPTTTIS
jgi:replicative DNA helicase